MARGCRAAEPYRARKAVMFDVPIDPHVGHSETLADLTSGQVTSIVGNADPVLDRAESGAHAAIGNPCPALAATAECEGGSGS